MIDSLRKLNRLLRSRDRRRVAALFLLMLVGSLLEVLGVGAIPAFVMLAASPERVQEYALVDRVVTALGLEDPRDLLLWGGAALLVIYLVKNTYISLLHWYKARFVFQQQVRLGDRLFSAYMDAPYTFHLERNPAVLLRNANEEVRVAVTGVLMPALKLAMDAVIIGGIVVLLFVIEPVITLATVGVLGTGSGLFLKFTRAKMKHFGRQEQVYRREMIQAIQQGIGGLKDARVLRREGFFKRAFRHAARKSADAAQYKKVVSEVTKPFIETVAVSGMLLVALLLLLQGRPVESVIPVLTLFGAAAVKLMPALKDLMTGLTLIRYSAVAVHPVHDDLQQLAIGDAPREAVDGRPNETKLKEGIEIQNVFYRYPNARADVLRGVSLQIPTGAAVAFVGASGAGKTTLVDLVLGLLEPTGGRILVDGADIATDFCSWQRKLGYIPQFIYLADDTIRRNIAFGLADEQIDEERVWKAVESAQLREFIGSLPDGLDTMVGDRGVRLSGGQRQRIGIARALYHDPAVLVMDEATSSLDVQTEGFVVAAIEAAKKDRTVIMIAHRLQTVRNCDTIFYMEHGVLKDVGTFDVLTLTSAGFREMAQVT
jgi:ATP-binding cassette, subfamily B, bacterial PglK